MPRTSFADLAPGLVCVLQQVVCAPCLLLRLNVISDCVEVSKCPRTGETIHTWIILAILGVGIWMAFAPARGSTQHESACVSRPRAPWCWLDHATADARAKAHRPNATDKSPTPARAPPPRRRGSPCLCLAASNPLPESPYAGVSAGPVRRFRASARSAPGRFGSAYVAAGTARAIA